MFPPLPSCPVCAPVCRPQHPPETGVEWHTLTFTLEQEEVHVMAERSTDIGAVLHQVTRQTLPVEVIYRVGAGRPKSQ